MLQVLGHRFERIRNASGVPNATLHRLRHTMPPTSSRTARYSRPKLALGQADAATTLREYSHALLAADTNIADAINDHLDLTGTTRRHPDHSAPKWVQRMTFTITSPVQRALGGPLLRWLRRLRRLQSVTVRPGGYCAFRLSGCLRRGALFC